MRIIATAMIAGGLAQTAAGAIVAMKQRGIKAYSGLKRIAMIAGTAKIDSKCPRIETRNISTFESDALD